MSFPFRTIMFASLAANLLIVGAVVGGSAAGLRVVRAPEHNAVIERMPGPRAFMLALPPEAREKLRTELTAAVPETREARATARQARVDVYAAARQEPYDPDRVRAAFAHMRESDQAVLAIFHDHVARAFAQLTPDQRRTALDALRNAQPAPAQPQQQQQPAQPGLQPLDQSSTSSDAAHPFRERMRERRAERLQQMQQMNSSTATATTSP